MQIYANCTQIYANFMQIYANLCKLMQILCQLVSNIEVLDKTKLKSNVIMQMSRSERERDGSAADLPVAR